MCSGLQRSASLSGGIVDFVVNIDSFPRNFKIQKIATDRRQPMEKNRSCKIFSGISEGHKCPKDIK
jgi:hypothetical protein